ncbi:MAG: WGR domain-containing protein [Candidatus Thorarchaeota archaeon]|jgi:predicted DNA-binding WGR domain protein
MTPVKSETTGRYERTTFTGSAGMAHEFWIATVEGKFVTIHFGKTGTAGYKASREFGTNQEARDFMLDRLRAQIEKGYVLVG